MTCDNCRRIVTQDEADDAADIFDAGTTLCQWCASSLRDAKHYDDEAEQQADDDAFMYDAAKQEKQEDTP